MKYLLLIVFVTTRYGLNISASGCNMSALPPDPRTQCCGVDSSTDNRIVGGKVAGLRQYPWLALVEYKTRASYSVQTLCGSFLISGQYVLTAAHCVTGDILHTATPVSVRLGDHDISNEGPDCVTIRGSGTDCTDGATSIRIQHIIPHPEFSETNVKNDIALIRLARMAPYTDFIRPICLPNLDVTANPPQNLRLYVAGWGTMRQVIGQFGEFENIGSKVKRHVDLPYWSFRKCQRQWGTAVGHKQICAGGERGKDACMGDSGGPLMHNNGGIFEAVGIVSFGVGMPCGKRGIPGVYTKVSEYDSWIRSQIRK